MSTTIDFQQVSLLQFITHHIGNKTLEENVILSEEISSISEFDTLNYLLTYFLSPFKPFDFYQFNHSVDIELNGIYSLVKKMFADKQVFVKSSQDIAKLLYEYSDHPKIKTGELNIAYFENVIINEIQVDAIGIYKSESNVPFLKMHNTTTNYMVEHDQGYELKGVDKACIIFNIDQENGYQILTIDNTNKSSDAQYWVNDFLRLTPCSDDYHMTKEFLNVTKEFITTELSSKHHVSKTEKIDLLNKTMDYFKSNEAFDKKDFEDSVFQNEEVIKSFRSFDDLVRPNNEDKGFEISSQAVKKQARVYKSVLKLDKNFHVYIHGDKSLIEKGTESDGRKYYKIYYENED